jgi:hypothetical protein
VSILIATVCIQYIAVTVLIGITYHAVKKHFGWHFNPKKDLIILIILFAIIDNFDWPMLFYMDATITIGNDKIASFLDIKPGTPIESLFDPEWFDLFIYLVQACFVSLFSIKKLKNKKID